MAISLLPAPLPRAGKIQVRAVYQNPPLRVRSAEHGCEKLRVEALSRNWEHRDFLEMKELET
jgi:hypothetical protein